MKKLTKKQLENIKTKLIPFWKKYWEIHRVYNDEILKLEKKMNKSLSLPIELEFFYVDGECVGIGAEDYSMREFFPLIQDLKIGT
ncbi:MAG: hypothetical protein KKF56_02645 [Nanoarchaeota archaeon]|nr:hypothetical protein [Nanoarchaeota archaeon]